MIQPGVAAGHEELAARLKLVASAGADAVRAVLDADGSMPVDEGHRLFDRRLQLDLKFDAAVTMPLRSDREKMAFLRMYSDLRLKERRLQLEERKLKQRCQEALQKHELAKVRLEHASERSEARDAEKARRRAERARIRELERQDRGLRLSRLRDQQRAEEAMAAARVAKSPLMRLTWGSSTKSKRPEQPVHFTEVPVTPAGLDAMAPTVSTAVPVAVGIPV